MRLRARRRLGRLGRRGCRGGTAAAAAALTRAICARRAFNSMRYLAQRAATTFRTSFASRWSCAWRIASVRRRGSALAAAQGWAATTAHARKNTTTASASPYRRPWWLVISATSASAVGFAVVTVVVGVDDGDHRRGAVVSMIVGAGAGAGRAAAGAGTGFGFGTAGSAGGFALSSFWSFAAYAPNCFARAATAASFVCRAARPRLVVRVTATVPRTVAPAMRSAEYGDVSLVHIADARRRPVRSGGAFGEASDKTQ